MDRTISALLADADANDDDVRNARRLLSHHVETDGVCRRCRSRFPCVPRRIAETLLRTAGARAADRGLLSARAA